MVVTKIHRVLEFQQFPWLQSYIKFNMDKRKAATSDFEKDFFKLMTNSVYGKSMESIRNRVNVELVNNQKHIKKALAKPTAKNITYVNDDIVMVQFAKKAIMQTKPMYTGFVVLELSKVIMYDFYYNHIQGQYGCDRARLLFIHTEASATKFRPTICTTTWQETFSTMTPVRILKPIICTAMSTQKS